MKQLLLFLLFIPSLLMAQEDQKYLAGAIPEEGGKVVFTKEINMGIKLQIRKKNVLTQ